MNLEVIVLSSYVSAVIPDPSSISLFSYGLIWVSTTLVFVIAALGNCATYLMQKRSDSSTSWSFDVSYVNVAACAVYGYILVVPLAFYFLLQYLGSNSSLVRLWCMWSYSLFIFILTAVSLSLHILFWLFMFFHFLFLFLNFLQ